MKVEEKILQEKSLDQIVADAYEAGHVFSEPEIRDLVGAPTVLEYEYCVCGELLNTCKHAYEHMTHGF
jgi:hypothetical protein